MRLPLCFASGAARLLTETGVDFAEGVAVKVERHFEGSFQPLKIVLAVC